MNDSTCGCSRSRYCGPHQPPCSECKRPSVHRLARGRCNGCYKRMVKRAKAAGTFVKVERPPAPLKDRLLSKVTPGRNGCWLYTGSVAQTGYGHFTVSASRRALAHRVAYELFNGPIPTGYQVDHQCHNRDEGCRSGEPCVHRRCVNPQHLDAVSPRVNTRRSPITQASRHAARTHCPQGHEYTDENTAVRLLDSRTGRTGRECRSCRRQRDRRRRAVR